MPEPNKEIFTILEHMRVLSGLRGIVLATKNGELVEKSFTPHCNKIMEDLDNFTAMCATVFESATSVAHNANKEILHQIMVELSDHNLILQECNKKMILISILAKSKSVSIFMAHFKKFLRDINKRINQ
jgi:predicted regulator of Ras-like GTPase activity (Roadblock/LC7/MglB family)